VIIKCCKHCSEIVNLFADADKSYHTTYYQDPKVVGDGSGRGWLGVVGTRL